MQSAENHGCENLLGHCGTEVYALRIAHLLFAGRLPNGTMMWTYGVPFHITYASPISM